ncbi:MAG TPA: hypothetical protein VNA20_01830 [Frankiaceae bacterium]|nr:hypothetical protein [Frankiaceae bacterium]
MIAGFSAAPGHAAAPKQTILRARSSASVDVTFTRPVRLDNDKVTVSGGRNYVGFYLHPLSSSYPNGTGNIYLQGYRDSRFDWLPLPLGGADFLSFPPRTVPAGRYRLYALGDGPVEVRIPFTGYAGRTLHATRPAKVAFVSKNVTKDLLPGGPARIATPGTVKVDLPITVVSNKSISFTTSQLITRGTARTTTNSTPSCIGAAEHPACVTESKEGNGGIHSEDQMIFAAAPPWQGIFLHNYGRYYFPGQINGGEQTAHFVLAAANTIDRAIVAAVSIGL